MRKFLYFICKILILLVLLMGVLDFAYTKIYMNFGNRGKIESVFDSEPKEFDVVILGSSRANNHFVTKMFSEKGLKTFNYGISGAGLYEMDLLLKLMMEHHYKIKNIILEVDINIHTDGVSDGVVPRYFPYMHDSETVKDHLKNLPDFNTLYYIPFYRYLANDAKIGFREAIMTAMHKKSPSLESGGYHALYGAGTNLRYDLPGFPVRNSGYEEIRQICRAKNINLIAISTPICKNAVNQDYFRKVRDLYPEVHDYHDTVQNDSCYFSCGHMNDEGAKLFTSIILRDFFGKKDRVKKNNHSSQ